MIHLAKTRGPSTRRASTSNTTSRFARKPTSPTNCTAGRRVAGGTSRRALARAMLLLVALKCIVERVANPNADQDRNKCNFTCRIDLAEGVALDIAVSVDAACKPDRIALDVSPRLRIIVPEVVVLLFHDPRGISRFTKYLP